MQSAYKRLSGQTPCLLSAAGATRLEVGMVALLVVSQASARRHNPQAGEAIGQSACVVYFFRSSCGLGALSPLASAPPRVCRARRATPTSRRSSVFCGKSVATFAIGGVIGRHFGVHRVPVLLCPAEPSCPPLTIRLQTSRSIRNV